MCYDWHQEYTECCHFSKKLIHCPAYHKQQNLAKTFFGRLLYGSVKNKKDCGRVIPHNPEPRPFCRECAAVVDQLRAKHVGEDAFLEVFRPNLDSEICHPYEGPRRRRRPEAEPIHKRLERYAESGKPTAAERSLRKHTKEKKTKRPEQISKRSCKQSRHGSANKPSVINYSQSPQVPLSSFSTYGQHHGHRHQRRKEVGKKLPTPPAPPKLPPKPHRPQMWCDTGDNYPVRKQRSISRKPLPAVPKQPPTSSVPPPTYEVYLNALRNPGPKFGKADRPPKPPPKKKKNSRISEELRSSKLLKMMGIKPRSPGSVISDLSFMCQDSKRLTNRASAAKRR
ncbi:hypothetical protein F5Y02DRAFT_75785 [Annulohypoxylon stygium]|nr:hypothetical protein F5Y02DRAFT_75785 [Annulohypoxylon stygium]